MKRIGLTVWQGRIAPVFDVARTLEVLEVGPDGLHSLGKISIEAEFPWQKVSKLKGAQVKTLICGAVSRCMLQMLMGAHVEVIPYITGEVEQVKRAFLENRLTDFFMPGCKGGGFMPGQGQRGRRGQCQGGGKRGQVDGVCVCPQCGYQEPHTRGVPCFEKKCPKCNTALTRG